VTIAYHAMAWLYIITVTVVFALFLHYLTYLLLFGPVRNDRSSKDIPAEVEEFEQSDEFSDVKMHYLLRSLNEV
jgi:hypothetical protein